MAKIIIAGDYCPYARVTKVIEAEDYKSIFDNVIKYTSKADYSVVNLEVPITDNNATPIKKCGPNLQTTSKALKAIKYAGFNLMTLANNHIYDFGDNGINKTLEECALENLDVVGAGKNLDEASRIFYKDIADCSFAFINCCEHEFTIATATNGGANPLNLVRQYRDIIEAKKKADRVIVIIHGGHEHYQLPSPRMKETYRFFIDAGADVVVNHHQHCYSGYEIYNDRPIFYGLGNFCFDWDNKRNIPWNEGYMLQLDINKEALEYKLIPYIQGDEDSGIVPMTNLTTFENNIKRLNHIIANDNLLEEEYEKYLKSSKRFFDYCLEPYRNRFMVKLFYRNLIPNIFPSSKIPLIENMIVCESHRDRLMYYLKNRREND